MTCSVVLCTDRPTFVVTLKDLGSAHLSCDLVSRKRPTAIRLSAVPNGRKGSTRNHYFELEYLTRISITYDITHVGPGDITGKACDPKGPNNNFYYGFRIVNIPGSLNQTNNSSDNGSGNGGHGGNGGTSGGGIIGIGGVGGHGGISHGIGAVATVVMAVLILVLVEMQMVERC